MNDADVKELIRPCTNLVGGLMKACHRIMDQFGWISDTNIDTLADSFNLSRAEVVGFIGFYHDFKTEPQPPKTIKICRAEACQANRVRRLIDAVERRLGAKIPCHTADSLVTVEYVYCLGLCAQGPAAMIDGKLIANISAEQILEQL